MRIPPTRVVHSILVCGLSILAAGCGGASFQAPNSLTVTATPSTIKVGGAVILKATVHLSDGTAPDVTANTQWTLSNTSLATLGNGVLTGKAPGTLTVQGAYVTSLATPQAMSSSAQVTITAAAAAASSPLITWNTPAAIQYGTALTTVQLNATASVPGSFAYTTAAGTVLKAGTQTLSAVFTPADANAYSTATATVQLTVTKATPTVTWGPLAGVAQGTALGAAQLDAVSKVQGTFSYSPAAGTVLPSGTRQLTATFSPSDTIDYAPVTANNSITVAPTTTPTITPVITWNTPAVIRYGTALTSVQLNATANVPGSFAYTTTAGTVLKAGTHMLSAIFTPADTKTYSAATATVQLTVTQASPTVTWAPLASIAQGTALGAPQLDAASDVQGSFSYSPVAGTVLPSGTRKLTATFSPSDTVDYAPVTASNSLTVTATAAHPSITWNALTAISYGTALSNTQLSATANVPGTFTYVPAAGTLLKAGTETLSATFTPTDTKAYSPFTTSVPLTVSRAIPVITWANPAPIAAGTALSAKQLDAIANVPGSFMYNPAAGAVFNAGTQQLTAVFSPARHDRLFLHPGARLAQRYFTSNPPTGPVGSAPTGCGGPTINVDSSMSTSALQSTISSAPSCALVVFAAGTYNITAPITLKCGVTYAGPVANPATAILNATFSRESATIFRLYSGSGTR